MGTANGIIAITTLSWSIVAAILAVFSVFAVMYIKKRIRNNRQYKHVLITEAGALRNAYNDWLQQLHNGEIRPVRLLNDVKRLNIRINQLMDAIPSGYGIDKEKLLPYQQALPELITDSQDFITRFKTDQPIQLSERLKQELISFQLLFSRRFTELINEIKAS